MSSNRMQQLLNICQNYFLHVSKTTLLKLTAIIFFNDLKIPMVDNCRYLGIAISTKNSDLDLKRQMRKIYANANLLLRKFSSCSVSVKCYLFKGECIVFLKKIILCLKMIHYPSTIRSHLVTIVPMAPFTSKSTSKLRSALHFRNSIVIPRFISRTNTSQY